MKKWLIKNLKKIWFWLRGEERKYVVGWSSTHGFRELRADDGKKSTPSDYIICENGKSIPRAKFRNRLEPKTMFEKIKYYFKEFFF